LSEASVFEVYHEKVNRHFSGEGGVLMTSYLFVTFGLATRRFCHNKNDEKNGQEAENRGSTQGPMPVTIERHG
jgi:hypothetical protein